eukprot:GHVH01004804.1.p1 GENE.GHVH01004804.1~~GHVH01004804.1.p1  ORF type:complete len:103 (-),score=7.21 GHVH01004804.1:272-580(-)
MNVGNYGSADRFKREQPVLKKHDTSAIYNHLMDIHQSRLCVLILTATNEAPGKHSSGSLTSMVNIKLQHSPLRQLVSLSNVAGHVTSHDTSRHRMLVMLVTS